MAIAVMFEKLVCRCEREKCGHVWIAAEMPKRCSKCKSPYWHIGRGAEEPVKPLKAVTKPTESGVPKIKLPEGGMMFPKEKWKVGGGKKKWLRGAK